MRWAKVVGEDKTATFDVDRVSMVSIEMGSYGGGDYYWTVAARQPEGFVVTESFNSEEEARSFYRWLESTIDRATFTTYEVNQ